MAQKRKRPNIAEPTLKELFARDVVRRCNPSTPRPSVQHQDDPPLMPGAGYFSQLFARFLGRARPQEVLDLKVWLREKKVLNVATACSGTDVPLLVYRGFATAIKDKLGLKIHLNHRFSCEQHAGKQSFLLTMFPSTPLLFNDATKLGSRHCHDVISGSEKAVPKDCSAMVAGWPCTDVSTLNKSSSSADNKSCVMTGSLRTGGVFRGLLDFCKQHGKRLDFLGNENIPKLARVSSESEPDNLTAAVWLLDTECDMWTKAWKLNPRLFGVPQDRDRCWFPSYRRRVLRGLGLSDDEASALLDDIMGRLVGCQLAPLDLYLLKPDSARLKEIIDSMPVAGDANAQTSTTNTKPMKWPDSHLSLFKQRGLKWWATNYPGDSEMAKYPMLARILFREFDLLHLRGVVAFPTAERIIAEVSQSADRYSSTTTDYIHAITPRMKFYLSDLCRFLVGDEELNLQSIFYEEPEKLSEFTNELLRNLSGNAFEGSCCAAVVFASYILLSKGAAARAGVPLSPQMQPEASADIDDEFDDIWGIGS